MTWIVIDTVNSVLCVISQTYRRWLLLIILLLDKECTVFYTSHLIFRNGINFSFVAKVRSAKLNYNTIKLAVGT